MENFWSLFKRGLNGIYHSVKVEHLDRYVDEFTYRFNNRKLSDGERFKASVPRIAGKRLTHSDLTDKGSVAGQARWPDICHVWLGICRTANLFC